MGKALFLTPKMGIVPELSIQNYEGLAKQFREYITNSVDAGAKTVRISINETDDGADLLLEDDGHGMTERNLTDEYLALGGSRKYENPKQVGRIGIGFLAMMPLCKKLIIMTRKGLTDEDKAQGAVDEIIVAEIWTDKLVMEAQRLEKIKDVQIGEVTDRIRDEESLASFPKHFTKLRLVGTNEIVRRTFADEKLFAGFRNELRRILPLEYPENNPLFELLSDELKEAIKKETKYKADVYLNSKEPLTRWVLGEAGGAEEVPDKVFVHELIREKVPGTKSVTVTGYIIQSKTPIPKNSQGIAARVLNVAVEEHTFFGLEGAIERKRNLTGEIFVNGMSKNEAISINRNQFREDYDDVVALKDFMTAILKEHFTGMNKRWRLLAKVKKDLKKVENIRTALEEMEGATKRSTTKQTKIVERPLSSRKTKPIANVSMQDLAGKHDVKGYAIRETSKASRNVDVEIKDHKGTSGEIIISADAARILQETITLFGTRYKVLAADGTADDAPCEVDIAKKTVYLNLQHPLMSGKNADLLQVAIVLAHARETARTVKQFHDTVLQFVVQRSKQE